MTATIATVKLRICLFAFIVVGFAVNLGGSPLSAAPAGSPPGANAFPNVELVNQDGQKVWFYDDLLKGKVFAINFIYTHCTATCPLETAAMRKIYNELGDHMGRDIFFYTISIDADRDDPATLKAYAERYKTGPGWSFLSGSKDDVTQIRQKLGMYSEGRDAVDLSGHSTVILMGAESVWQWIKRSPFEEPKALARILKTRLLRKHDAPASGLAKAGEVTDPLYDTPGAKLFRADCSACHSVGSEPGIGPGLAGITKSRDRAWLKRWIKQPDQMLKDKDPLALALFKQYNQIYMPNLQLNDQEVEGLLAYLETTAKE